MVINKSKKYYVIAFLVVATIIISCSKKEEDEMPKPITPQPIEAKKVELNMSFTKTNFDSTVSKTKVFTTFLKAYIYNLDTTNDELSDSTFVWERLTYSAPKHWILAFCDPELCNDKDTQTREFTLRVGKKGLIDFNIGAMDSTTQTAMELGPGVMTTTYVIYRKGMDKKDGQLLTVNFKAE